MRTLVTLACTNPDRIELKKYCKWCNAHTVHKETR